jgi:hypothetical protein
MAPLPSGTISGNLFEITSDTSGSELDPSPIPSMKLVLVSSVKPRTLVTWETKLYKVDPITIIVGDDGSFGPVRILAKDVGLGGGSALRWRAEIHVGEALLTSFWFDAPNDGQALDIGTITRTPA